MMYSRIGMLVLAVLALSGLMISNALLSMSNRTAPAGGWLARVCSAGGENTCDRVLQSEHAVITIPGVGTEPAAMWGGSYFAFLGAWYLAVGRPNYAGRYWHLVPLLVNTIGVLIAIWFTYTMVVELHAVCRLCLSAHVVNGLMLAQGIALWPRKPKAPKSQEGEAAPVPVAPIPAWRHAAVSLAFCVVLVGMLRAVYARNVWAGQVQVAKVRLDRLYANPGLARALFAGQPVQTIPARADDVVRGPADAAHTVVVFSDFECIRCQQFAVFFRKHIEPNERLSVRIVFKHYPLNPDCNPHARRMTHPNACAAARAAEAGRLIGGNEGFWRMHDQLFLAENQRALTQAPYRRLAQAAGLDADRLIAEMNNPAAEERIVENAALGAMLGVRGTPSVYLDGRFVETWSNLAFWQAVLAPAPATQPSVSAPR